MADKGEKEVKVNLAFTSGKLFLYGAIVDSISGFLWAILAAAGSSEGVYRASEFFQGFFFTVLGGLVLYGLAQIVKSKE